MWPICCDPGLRAGVRGLIPLQPRAEDAECPGSTGRSAECRASCSSNYRSAIKKTPIIRFPKGFRPGASSLRSVPAGSGAPEPLSPRQAPCLQMGKGDRWLRARLEAAEPAPGCQRDRKGAPEHKHGQLINCLDQAKTGNGRRKCDFPACVFIIHLAFVVNKTLQYRTR